LINQIADRIGINRTVLALSMARLGDAIGNSILFIVIPLYVAKLPAPFIPLPESVRVGILISLYGLVNSALQPLMGAISDHLGRRKPLIQIGLIIMGVGTLAFSLVGRFTDMLLLRALQGVGVALTIPASMALMANATQQRTRGGSMGIYSAMRMLGFAVGPLLGGYLFDNFGFNPAFYAGGAFILFGMLLVQVWVKDTPVKADHKATRPAFKVMDRSLLSAGIVGAAIASLVMASDFSMISALENQFNARLNQTAFGFGVAFSAMMVSRLIFQIPLGRWSDKIGRKPLIIGGLILMAPVTTFLGAITTTFQFIGLRFFQGIGSAAVAAPAFALGADLSKAGGEGRQMSLITMGFGLGIALGPLMAGVLAVYSFLLPFLVAGVLSLLGAWVVFHFVPETIAGGWMSGPEIDASERQSQIEKLKPSHEAHAMKESMQYGTENKNKEESNQRHQREFADGD
jgi:MFS family permease